MPPSEYGIWVLEYVQQNTPVNGWLKSFDPEAHEGRGWATFTHDFAEALHFKSIAAATTFWRTQSKTRPLRPDGKPNRPLTSFTVEVARLSDPRPAALAEQEVSDV